MAEDIKALKERLVELERENEKLNRRVKLLTKRVKKIQLENSELNEEIEKVEAISERVGFRMESNYDGCPNCGSSLLRISLPNGQVQVICENTFDCNYRIKV